LDELVAHPERYPETADHLFAGGVAAIKELEDALPEIH
jgi:hypothetical protein